VPFSIGAPGRAGLERPAGAPAGRIGHADVEISAAAAGGMFLTAATVRGVQHRAIAQPRQDAFAIGSLAGDGDSDGGQAIAVVCDGVGSLGRSDEAADLVSRNLVRLRQQGLTWPDAFAAVNELLRATAAAAPPGTGDADASGMATTAVAVSVGRAPGGWAGEVAWVGDSALWHLSAGEQWTLITCAAGDDPGDDYHSTGVTALPSADGGCATREFCIPDGSLFLMSDGVANPLKWSEAVQKQLGAWWAESPDPFTFAAQVSFARKSHMDDRTVIGIWPGPAAPAQDAAGDAARDGTAGPGADPEPA
jgi:Protein phosphatase 2C